MGRNSRAARVGLLALLLAASGAAAQDMPRCRTDPALLDLGVPLDATRRAAAERKTVRIVAIGSSSTQGYGATTPVNTYPAQIMRRLGVALSGVEIVLFNRGIGGQDTDAMADRIERDVLAEKPDLVIFQAGTNAAMRRVPLERFRRRLDIGVGRARAGGADVVMMDLQYAPAIDALPDEEAYVATMGKAAGDLKVGLFRRFAIMKTWVETGGMSWADFMTSDGLHLNDFGQKCTGKLLAEAIGRKLVDGATIVPPAK